MDELDRLYRRLVHNIRMGFPDLLTRPFEVQQLYQTLVPYRHHRKELEIDTNDEYEIALMRLVSGERGYVRADPQMQEAVRKELMSPHPDTATFRSWAASPISLAPEALQALEASPSGSMPGLRPTSATPGLRSIGASPSGTRPAISPTASPGPPAPSPRASAALGGQRAYPAEHSPGAPMPPAHAAASTAAAANPGPARPSGTARPAGAPAPAAQAAQATAAGSTRAAGGGTCRYCGGTLPTGRAITYCPHCGQNLTVVHCPACGTELELGWKFCVSCGRSVG